MDDIEKMKTKSKQQVEYIKLHKVLGEGNFVLSQLEVDLDGMNTVKMDLFRIEENKIVEHWDSIFEDLPEQMAHDNSLF